MSMMLYLGKFECDEATINKTGAVAVGEATGSVRTCEPYDEVTFNDQLALVTKYNPGDENYNYAKVVSHTQDVGGTKYYYIRNRIMAPGGKIIFLLECDVLYTYRTQIYSLPCVCRRAGSKDEDTPNAYQDPYIFDEKMPVRTYKSVDLYLTEKPEEITASVDFNFDPYVYVIVTAG